ncbi:MAG: RluA family pseudouridine synthase [Spirochaetales bacterium]|uniref:RluA family pseudouridine synthase n=1 Tax=Candidatus Thalassospirochaeta sargassi TaxID=3119039 RepID=A0AAJ1IGG0_9SPIO|nr:RluA family pseudouridine synthase [Spirochaetales bacterium]
MLVLQSVKGYNLFICGPDDEGRRLDRVLKKLLPDIPAGLIYSGLRKGLIRVNEKKSKQSDRLQQGDQIAVRETIIFQAKTSPPPADSGAVYTLKKITVFSNENLLLLNKPAGMLTHGDDSLASLLQSGLDAGAESLSFRPAPLHRLDRNTSGLITASLSIKGAHQFSELMRGRRLKKYYLGICIGGPDKKVKLSDRLQRTEKVTRTLVGAETDDSGNEAVTFAESLIREDGLSLCLFRIETGLTHQIRAQAAAAGFPLAGDVKYGGGRKGFRTFILHSFAISLEDFDEICGFKTCTAPLPPRSQRKAESLFGAEILNKTIEKIKIEINS